VDNDEILNGAKGDYYESWKALFNFGICVFMQVGPSLTLTPVVPGINLPIPNALPFFISILFSTLFHELGHGISAAAEFTDVGGVGLAVIG
jgi:hypothetical protein